MLGGLGPQATLDFCARVMDHSDAARDQDHLHVVVVNNPRLPNRNEAIAGTTAFVHELERMGLVEATAPASPPTPLQSGESPSGEARPAPRRLTQSDATEAAAEKPPLRVLFVCTGNICRSAYAEHRATAAAVPGVTFASAGIQAMVGYPMDPPMVAAFTAQGTPAPHQASTHQAPTHRARQLTRDLADDHDLILTMSPAHRAYVLEEWPHLAHRTFMLGQVAREITDAPTPLTLDGLREHLWSHRTRRSDDDVSDPYGRGQQAADECAARIDALLAPILVRLKELRPDAG